jgi:hypothetical protein
MTRESIENVRSGAATIQAVLDDLNDRIVRKDREIGRLSEEIATLRHRLRETPSRTPSAYVFRHNCGLDDEAIAYAESGGCTVCPPFFYWGALLNDRNDEEPSSEKIAQWCQWHVPADYDGPLVLDMEDIPDGQQWFTRLREKDPTAVAFYHSLIDAVLVHRPNAKITFWGMPPLRKGGDSGHWGRIPDEWRKNRRDEVLWCTDLWNRFDWFLPQWYQWFAEPDVEARKDEQMFREDLATLCREIADTRLVISCLWTRCGEGPFRNPALFQRDDLLLASRLAKQGVIDGVAIWSDPKMPLAHTKPYLDAAVDSIINPEMNRT